MLFPSAPPSRRRLPRESRDFIFRQAALSQKRNGVLAQGRHLFSRGDIGARHTKRQVENIERAAAIPDLGQCTTMGDLRIAQCFGDRTIGRTGNTMAVQLGEAFLGRERARPLLYAVHQITPVAAPRRLFPKAPTPSPSSSSPY